MLRCILLLMDLAAVGEALVWCKRGDIYPDCRLKTTRCLFNVCLDERCLDQMKRVKKKPKDPTPKSLMFPRINHKNSYKNPSGCFFSCLSQFG